jgi:hypothetical protein
MFLARPTTRQRTPWGPKLLAGDPINRGLLAYWPLGDNAGTVAREVLRPDVQTASLNGYPTGWVPGVGVGRKGRSLAFNGSSNYGLASIKTPLSAVSVSFWATFGTITAGSIFANIGGQGATAKSFAIGVSPNATTAYFGLWGSTTINPTIPSVSGRRIHIVGTINTAGLMTLYHDGKVIGTPAGTQPYIGDSTVIIGAYWDFSLKAKGEIDNFRVHNHALSAREVRRLYRDTFAGLAAPDRLIFIPAAVVGGVTFITARLAATSRASAAPAASAAPSVLASSTSRVSAAPAAAAAVSLRATGNSRAGGILTAAATLTARVRASSRMAGAAAAAVAITARVSASSRAGWAISTGTIVQLALRMAASSRAALAPVASAVLASRARAASRASAGSQATAAVAIRARAAARGSAAPAASAAITARMAVRVRVAAVPTTTAFPHLWVPRPLWIV